MHSKEAGQVLVQFAIFTGSTDIFTTMIREQPKRHPGLNLKVKEERKGKTKGNFDVDFFFSFSNSKCWICFA